MNTTGSLYMEMPLAVAEIQERLVSNNEGENIVIEKDQNFSINNYLKTPDEIDAELCSEMNSKKKAFPEHKFLIDSYERIFKNRSDNAYGPDNNPSGFMEENY